MEYNEILKAAQKCCNGVRWKHSTQMFEINILRWTYGIDRDIKAGTYHGKGFRKFRICERGKMRDIQAVHISERAAQKALTNAYLKPILVPTLISANSASLEGRGTEYALKRLKQDLAHAYKKYGKDFYVLTIDLHDYFNSIPHQKVLDMASRYIKGEAFDLLNQFVNEFKGDKGLGLGSEVSQILAIFYASGIDHYIKEHLHIKGYGRYMDDMYLIHPDKTHLHKCLDAIRDMFNELDITLNESKTAIHKGRFVFLKKRITLTDTGKIIMRPTRKNITTERRKLKTLGKKLSAGETTVEHIKQSFECWDGYTRKLNCYRTRRNMKCLYKEVCSGYLSTQSKDRQAA